MLFGLLLWFTFLPCGSEQPLVQAVHGCRLSAMEAFGRIPCYRCCVSRCSHLENWTLLLRLRIFQHILAFGCACGVQRIGFLGDPACTLLGSTVIHVLRGLWQNLHIFYVSVNSNPEAFALHSAEWRSVHSRCFWLQLLSARLARWNLGWKSRSFFDSLRQFSLHSAAFSGGHFIPEVLWTYTHSHMSLNNNTQRTTHTTHNTQHTTHNTQHRVQTHSFSRCEQFVLVISVHKIAANPIPGRERESSKHRRARARRSLARNWLRVAKAGWLTHSGKRRTTRALRLLRRHHRSEAPCMAPKQSTRPRTAAQPNDAEKKVQCGACNSDSWIFAHKWTPGRICRFCCSRFPKPVARAQSVGKRATVDVGSAPAGGVEPWLREILQEKLDVAERSGDEGAVRKIRALCHELVSKDRSDGGVDLWISLTNADAAAAATAVATGRGSGTTQAQGSRTRRKSD